MLAGHGSSSTLYRSTEVKRELRPSPPGGMYVFAELSIVIPDDQRFFTASAAAPRTNQIHSCSVNNTCENFSSTFQIQLSAMTITVIFEEFHNLKQ